MIKGSIFSTRNADVRFCSSRHVDGEDVLIKVNSFDKAVNLMYSSLRKKIRKLNNPIKSNILKILTNLIHYMINTNLNIRECNKLFRT